MGVARRILRMRISFKLPQTTHHGGLYRAVQGAGKLYDYLGLGTDRNKTDIVLYLANELIVGGC